LREVASGTYVRYGCEPIEKKMDEKSYQDLKNEIRKKV
jgi:hypothetical protein